MLHAGTLQMAWCNRAWLQPKATRPYLLFRLPHHPTAEPAMNFEILIPITLFICIVYAIKVVVDARLRKQMVDSNGAQDLVRSMLESEELQRRHASLRWGIILVALAAAFGLIQASGWNEVTPGVIALLIGATGLGNLAYYMLSRRLG
jgi:hypothetical protein